MKYRFHLFFDSIVKMSDNLEQIFQQLILPDLSGFRTNYSNPIYLET